MLTSLQQQRPSPKWKKPWMSNMGVILVGALALLSLILLVRYAWGPKTSSKVKTTAEYERLFRDISFTYQMTRQELGATTWPLLHMIAGGFPEEPTEEDKKYAKQFLDSLAHLYPCKKCRKHFRQMLDEFPPNFDSRVDFSNWFCEAHNKVNERTHKPQFPCDRVLQAWPSTLKGDCGCSDDEKESPEHGKESTAHESHDKHDAKKSSPHK